jgi:hypothetical protein
MRKSTATDFADFAKLRALMIPECICEIFLRVFESPRVGLPAFAKRTGRQARACVTDSKALHRDLEAASPNSLESQFAKSVQSVALHFFQIDPNPISII